MDRAVSRAMRNMSESGGVRAASHAPPPTYIPDTNAATAVSRTNTATAHAGFCAKSGSSRNDSTSRTNAFHAADCSGVIGRAISRHTTGVWATGHGTPACSSTPRTPRRA
jgi:hypothetical protein